MTFKPFPHRLVCIVCHVYVPPHSSLHTVNKSSSPHRFPYPWSYPPSHPTVVSLTYGSPRQLGAWPFVPYPSIHLDFLCLSARRNTRLFFPTAVLLLPSYTYLLPRAFQPPPPFFFFISFVIDLFLLFFENKRLCFSSNYNTPSTTQTT